MVFREVTTMYVTDVIIIISSNLLELSTFTGYLNFFLLLLCSKL